jgi:hypothetical protein
MTLSQLLDLLAYNVVSLKGVLECVISGKRRGRKWLWTVLMSLADVRVGEWGGTKQLWISKIGIRSLAEFRYSRFWAAALTHVDM